MDEGPGEHDVHLMTDDLDDTVPCAHCGRQVWIYVQRCPHCGIHFSSESWQFAYPGGPNGQSFRVWWWLLVTLVMIALLAIRLW